VMFFAGDLRGDLCGDLWGDFLGESANAGGGFLGDTGGAGVGGRSASIISTCHERFSSKNLMRSACRQSQQQYQSYEHFIYL